MAKLIQYPETVHFREVVSEVTRHTRYATGDRSKPFPTLTFIGTVKLHGSNTAIIYQQDIGHWCQSRNRVLNPGNDHAEFAQHMDPLAQTFFTERVLLDCPSIREYYGQGSVVVVYGEWCGDDIQAQSDVAITGLPKMFVIFKIKIMQRTTKSRVSAMDASERHKASPGGFWLDPQAWRRINWHEKLIYNIFDFPTYEIQIDFNAPELSQSTLTRITDDIEGQCPVGTYFERVGCGEGVVWSEWNQTHGCLTFKVKGRKYAVVNAPVLASVSVPQLNSIPDFIEYACTTNRMQQAYDAVYDELGSAMEAKGLNTFLRWLAEDIIKEEQDTMDAASIHRKDVTRGVNGKAEGWFNQRLNDHRKEKTRRKKNCK